MKKKLLDVLYYTLIVFMVVFSCMLAVYQAFREVTLIDYSYMVEVGYRIYLGQTPYKDFILMYPVGLFYLIALFYKMFGTGSVTIAAMQACVQLAYCGISFILICKVTKKRLFRTMAFLPVVLSGHVLATNPNYDVLVSIAVLLTIVVWLRVREKQSFVGYVLSGFVMATTFLFKQNVSLAFGVIFILLLVTDCIYKRASLKNTIAGIIGSTIGVSVLVITMLASGFATDVINQLYVYPTGERGPVEVVLLSFKTFFAKPNLIWLIAGAVLFLALFKFIGKQKAFLISSVTILLIGPLAYEVYMRYLTVQSNYMHNYHNYMYSFTCCWFYFFILAVVALIMDLKGRKISENGIFIILILMYIGANLTSQGVEGSTYALYPVLSIMLLLIFDNYKIITYKLTQVAIFLCIAGTLCVLFKVNGRVLYINIYGDVNVSRNEKMAGLHAHREFLPWFDELVNWVETEVPEDETFVVLPGEDPIYVVSGRYPQLRYFHLNQTMFPYDMETYARDCIDNNITYVILKKNLQCVSFFDYSNIVSLLDGYYDYYVDLGNYTIYKSVSQ